MTVFEFPDGAAKPKRNRRSKPRIITKATERRAFAAARRQRAEGETISAITIEENGIKVTYHLIPEPAPQPVEQPNPQSDDEAEFQSLLAENLAKYADD